MNDMYLNLSNLKRLMYTCTTSLIMQPFPSSYFSGVGGGVGIILQERSFHALF